MDKDTLDKLIAHFNQVIKNVQDDPETQVDDDTIQFFEGYRSGLLFAIVDLELLRDGEMELNS